MFNQLTLPMNGVRHLILSIACAAVATASHAQYNNSGISAGFFDSSENSTINFSNFHLPPLAVLYENAKQNPQILLGFCQGTQFIRIDGNNHASSAVHFHKTFLL